MLAKFDFNNKLIVLRVVFSVPPMRFVRISFKEVIMAYVHLLCVIHMLNM
jgi:hypothetical protein